MMETSSRSPSTGTVTESSSSKVLAGTCKANAAIESTDWDSATPFSVPMTKDAKLLSALANGG